MTSLISVKITIWLQLYNRNSLRLIFVTSSKIYILIVVTTDQYPMMSLPYSKDS